MVSRSAWAQIAETSDTIQSEKYGNNFLLSWKQYQLGSHYPLVQKKKRVILVRESTCLPVAVHTISVQYEKNVVLIIILGQNQYINNETKTRIPQREKVNYPRTLHTLVKLKTICSHPKFITVQCPNIRIKYRLYDSLPTEKPKHSLHEDLKIHMCLTKCFIFLTHVKIGKSQTAKSLHCLCS